MELACRKDLLVMSDEIYEYLLYDGSTHYRPASFSSEAAERVITVSGFSKTFSMTGWRLGTLVANPVIAKAVASLQKSDDFQCDYICSVWSIGCSSELVICHGCGERDASTFRS